jgi:hypothetical protein
MSTRPRRRNRANASADHEDRPLLGVAHTDIQKHLVPGTTRNQRLRGFDPEYVDIVNYIVRCTHRIWEEGGMGLIYTHYLHNAKVHTADGWFVGRDQVVANSIQSLYAFPDERAYADAVVWTGDDQDGFYSNHLVYSTQHHTGHSIWGPPTGRALMRPAMALCYVKENLICEEWLLYDEITMIRHMGLDLNETVARFAKRMAAQPPQHYGDLQRTLGQYAPEPLPAKAHSDVAFDVDDFLRRNLHEIWNMRMLNVIRDVYDENYQFHGSAGRELYGRGDYTAFVLSLLAAFPDARFSIDQLYWMDWHTDGQPGYRTSMRWSLVGTHEGDGIFGEPTGQRFRLWGMTQHLIQDGKLIEEWTLFNEFSLLKRLYLARQAEAHG